MGGTRRCSSCGHEMPETARVCLLCGRDAPAQEVELQPVDDAATPPGGDRVVAEAGGGKIDRRVPLVVGAAVVVLLALVALLAGGDDGDDDDGGEAAAEEASATTTTDAPRPTRTPTTRVRPATTTPTPTTTTEPPPFTAVSSVTPTPQPVLGKETGGLSLYAASGVSIARIELDTGRVTAAPRAFTGGTDVFGMYVMPNGIYVWHAGANGAFVVPLDLSGPPEQRSVPYNCCPLPGTPMFEHGRLGDGEISVIELTPDGGVPHQWTLTQSASFGSAMTVVDGRLLLSLAGRLYLLGEDGSAEPWATGEFVASRGDRVLWRGCDDRMVCTLRLGDAQRSDRRVLQWSAGRPTANAWRVMLSPDGTTMVMLDVLDSVNGASQVIDLETGAVLASVPALLEELTWTPDGTWLLGPSGPGVLFVLNLRDGTRIEIGLPEEFWRGQDIYLGVG